MSQYQYQIKDLNATATAISSGARARPLARVRTPRILMVGMHLTKTRGGISTLTAGILNSDLNRDHAIRYIASQAEDCGRFRKLTLAIGSAFRFAWTCLVWQPALVYVHMGSNASLYRESIFVVLGKLLRKRVLIHFHAGDIDNYYPRQPAIGRKFIKYAVGLSDRVIAVSEESGRQLRALRAGLNMAIIPNAIDIGDFLERKVVESGKQTTNTVRLLFVGAIGKLKGENDLIAALVRVKDVLPDLKVSILGYGSEDLVEKCVQGGIAHLIEHLGAVSLSERIAFYERADIFVLPTYAEAMPISVIEAMASGLPVITTAVGGIPELIDDGQEGLLFEPGNVPILAEKILLLSNDKKVRQAMGKRARMRVIEQMNFPQYIERLRGELGSVCGPRI